MPARASLLGVLHWWPCRPWDSPRFGGRVPSAGDFHGDSYGILSLETMRLVMVSGGTTLLILVGDDS